MIAKKSTLRRTRTKLRKPKFLSLRLQLFSTAGAPPLPMPTTGVGHDQTQLINLFPLHPENLVEQDKLDEDHNMAACIFSSCDDDGAATTLTGILCSDDDDEEEEENMNNPSPSSVNYADDDGELIRTAMRRNNYKTENDDHYSNHHEKWVCYSEVVERKRGLSSSSLTSSTSTSCNHDDDDDHRSRSRLALKLDYEKIMKSWVNKGPLYIGNDPGLDTWQPQIVPDLRDDDFFLPFSAALNGMTHDERDNVSNGGLWTVPEMTHNENNDIGKGEDVSPMAASTMIQNREASVQRYKEKRRNRLFAKTIRYEVRKLNAEKRPRIKGRFVKRN